MAYINPHDDTICGVVTVVVFGYNFWYNFACCVALIYNISCASVCVPKNEAKKKIVRKLKPLTTCADLRPRATEHRAPHLASSVELLQRSRVARPATGSNSPLNALEPSFVPKNKKFKFQIL